MWHQNKLTEEKTTSFIILENVGAKLLAFSTVGLTNLRCRHRSKPNFDLPYQIPILRQELLALAIKILRWLDENAVLETTMTEHDSSSNMRVLYEDALWKSGFNLRPSSSTKTYPSEPDWSNDNVSRRIM